MDSIPAAGRPAPRANDRAADGRAANDRAVSDRVVSDRAAIDVDALTEQIWRELDGRVSRDAVRQAVAAAATQYLDARILSYVPIFVRRDALSTLARRQW